MNTVPITVAVPVGPLPHNRRWLEECLESVWSQAPLPSEVLVVNDGGAPLELAGHDTEIVIPWPSGVGHAHNYCVAGARNGRVIVLNSDDKLLPGAVGAAWAAYERERDDRGYYWFDVAYSDGMTQTACDGCGMATQGLWRMTGGLPVEGAVGAADWMFISLLHTRGLARHLHRIAPEPLYWYRQHPETDTNRQRGLLRGELQKAVLAQLTREYSA